MTILNKLLILTLIILNVACNKEEDPVGKETKDPSGTFVRKTLIEHISGVHCSNCPPILDFFDKNEKVKKYCIPVVLQNGIKPRTEMRADNYNKVETLFEFKGIPAVFVNRKNTKNKYRSVTKIKEQLKEGTSPISIKISSKLTQTKGTVSFDVKVNSDLPNLKYSLYILADGYKEQQDGRGDNYVHKHVLRKAVIVNKPFKFTKNVVKSIKVPEFGYNLLNRPFSHASVVVFITDNSGKVIQAEIAKANKTAESLVAK